jgi:hypothetical protein
MEITFAFPTGHRVSLNTDKSPNIIEGDFLYRKLPNDFGPNMVTGFCTKGLSASGSTTPHHYNAKIVCSSADNVKHAIRELVLHLATLPSEFETAALLNMEKKFLAHLDSLTPASQSISPAFKQINGMHVPEVVKILRELPDFPDADKIGKALHNCKSLEEVQGV